MTNKVDVLIVGAGFAGIYALHKFRQMGYQAQVIDAASGIGGTWFWNSYPGARCDVESLQYSYSFDEALQQEWQWTERYAGQPEILKYLQHVVDRFSLADGIQLNNQVQSARYIDGVWLINTALEDFTVRFLVMASGCLSKPNKPDYPGLSNFTGESYHTGLWALAGIEPGAASSADIDLNNKKVAVLGTGSSGVQIISEIAPQVQNLTVFQRTPHWVVPAGNHALSKADSDKVKARYQEFRRGMETSFLGMEVSSGEGGALDVNVAERAQRYQVAWDKGGAAFLMSFNDLLVNHESNRTACDFIGEKINAIVDDAKVAAQLTPDPVMSQLGARRVVQDDGYYATYNRGNVQLIDTRQQVIEKFTETGIQTSNGHIELDVVIFAIGFDAVTGALLNFDIEGKGGQMLSEKWQAGAKSYLGIGMAGFPNLFTVTGPGSPSVFSNMVLSIEQHIDWITAAIDYIDSNNFTTMEVTAEAENAWVEKVASVVKGTVIDGTAGGKSWYLGSNIPGKPRVILPYLGGVGPYRAECDEIVAEAYRGFLFS